MNPDFHSGNKVKINIAKYANMPGRWPFDGIDSNGEMLSYEGKIATIKTSALSYNVMDYGPALRCDGYDYSLDIDQGKFHWPNYALELVEEE